MDELITNKERTELLKGIERQIGYEFNVISHLDKALRHKSYRKHPEHVAEYRNINECMEFLGDAILDFVIGEYLYNLHTDWDEGKLSKFRARVVCEQSLVIVANRLELWRYILVGKGEHDGQRMNNSIMADAVEAIFAGVYMDGGMEMAKECIMRLLKRNIDDIENGKILRDTKTELQELVQQYRCEPIIYKVLSQIGPQHDSVFTVSAELDGQSVGIGKGKSKKEAEQQAASAALGTVKNILQKGT